MPEVIEDIATCLTEIGTLEGPSLADVEALIVDFQRRTCPVYGEYCRHLGLREGTAFLPIAAFRDAALMSGSPSEAGAVFRSSGTSRLGRSSHHVRRLAVYRRSISVQFERVFGAGPVRLLVFLPGYADLADESSLVYMLRHLIDAHGDEASRFLLEGPELLQRAADRANADGCRTLVFGVAFGLLDFAERNRCQLPPGSRVIETGGMKGRRREISRSGLHAVLAEAFGVEREAVRSEYGMCELLSQCYTDGGEVFFPPTWMRFEVLDPENPLRPVDEGSDGVLAVFDAANLFSVSAVLTEDRAVRRGDGFEVLGRLEGADLRGCNLLLPGLQDATAGSGRSSR